MFYFKQTLPRDVPSSYDTLSRNKKTGAISDCLAGVKTHLTIHGIIGNTSSHHHGPSSPVKYQHSGSSLSISTPFYCVDSVSITREMIYKAATSPRMASVPLSFAPSKWPLMPSVKFRARCALSAPIEHSGFLTLFTTSTSTGTLPAWHRRWAHLRTTEICFYKEPDADLSNPVGPLPLFDLHNVSADQPSADQVSPFVCARPWTLELVLGHQTSGSSASSVTSSYDNESHRARLWFAADTRQDFMAWRDAINRALSAIKLWGLIGKCPVTGNGTTSNTDSDDDTSV